MTFSPLRAAGFAFLCAAPLFVPPALAGEANCKNTGNFNVWLDGFRKEAAAEGVKSETIRAALGGMAFAPDIIARDRGQKIFALTFLDFSAKLASANRLQSAKAAIARHKAAFDRAEKEYGVPGPVIAAFWALESDFGSGMGNLPILRSLATLAYDCRRPELFRPELMAALKLIDRGDFRPEQMIGSWAGELGQTQFLPTLYLEHATDGDGDGKADLLRDPADIILSTAKYIASLGWRTGEPWIEEARVPAELPWDQADLAIDHQRGKWADWGVTKADGSAMRKDGTPVSLLLPMGRHGPAFLAYANFKQVYLKWNESLNYSATAAYLATRVAGAGAMSKGNRPVAALSYEQAKEVQSLLVRKGYDVGKIDGTIGAKTRMGVKAMQQKFGLPADSYPTPELLAALRGEGGAARRVADDTSAAEPAPAAAAAAKPSEAPGAKPKPTAKKRVEQRARQQELGLPQ